MAPDKHDEKQVTDEALKPEGGTMTDLQITSLGATGAPNPLFYIPTSDQQGHFKTTFLINAMWDQEPQRYADSDENVVFHIEWPGFYMHVPWPEGLSAKEAVAKWIVDVLQKGL